MATPLVGLGAAALLVTASTFAATATFESPAPGADLEPVGEAEDLLSLRQTEQAILWTAVDGTVTSYVVVGWPSSDGDAELGGAMIMRRPEDGSAGAIDFGERPRRAHFELDLHG